MSVLLATYEGAENSAKVILDKIVSNYDKLYLKNDKNACVKQVLEQIQENSYDYIIVFGQKPIIKDKVCIEKLGKLNTISYVTDYDYCTLSDFIMKRGFPVKISSNAGTSYCNHLYAHCLEYFKFNNLEIKMVFIHIPFLKNISNIDDMSVIFSDYINSI